MLAGIAGRTIEEARENMSVDEIKIWQAYIEKNGPLAIQRRIEYTAAQMSMILVNQNRDPKSQPLELERFLLWQKSDLPDLEEGDDVNKVVRELRRVAMPEKEGETRRRRWKRRIGV